MKPALTTGRRGSALLVSLGVLALLALIAITFAQLTRLDSQVAANYLHGTEAEFLAKGALTYCLEVLRADGNPQTHAYTEADALAGRCAPGQVGKWIATPFSLQPTIAGMIVGRDEFEQLGLDRANVYEGYDVAPFHASESWQVNTARRKGDDTWLACDTTTWPRYNRSFRREQNYNITYFDPMVDNTWYADLIVGRDAALFEGNRLFPSVPFSMTRGFQWAARIQPNLGSETGIVDLNVVGNFNTSETAPGDVWDSQTRQGVHHFGEDYSPADLDLENFLGHVLEIWGGCDWYEREPMASRWFAAPYKSYARQLARRIIQARGGALGYDPQETWKYRNDPPPPEPAVAPPKPGQVNAPWTPQPGANYFSVAEGLETVWTSQVPGTSRLRQICREVVMAEPPPSLPTGCNSLNDVGDELYRLLTRFTTTYSADTMLRNEFYDGEDVRKLEVLKRVNPNVLGLMPYATQAQRDRQKREQDRLYYMAKAAALAKGTSTVPDPMTEQQASQFAAQLVANVTDMVDYDLPNGTGRDKETVYTAPDGSGIKAVGVEKFPVINEVARQQDDPLNPDSQSALLVELYNPMEYIPWSPAPQYIDLEYKEGGIGWRLRVGTDEVEITDLKVVRVNGASVEDEADQAKLIKHSGRLMSDTNPGRFLVLSLQSKVTVLTESVDIELIAPPNPDDSGSPGYVVDRAKGVKLLNTGGGNSTQVRVYRRRDPLEGGFDGSDSNVAHSGSSLGAATTMGHGGKYVNGNYEVNAHRATNFKILDGYMPNIGWLGELMLSGYTDANDGQVLFGATPKGKVVSSSSSYNTNWVHNGDARKMNHADCTRGAYWDGLAPRLLDLFTTIDPSTDGIDNDGDGTIDDEDTGDQPGDIDGPEIRVAGKMDVNYMLRRYGTSTPDGQREGPWFYEPNDSGDQYYNDYVAPWNLFNFPWDVTSCGPVPPALPAVANRRGQAFYALMRENHINYRAYRPCFHSLGEISSMKGLDAFAVSIDVPYMEQIDYGTGLGVDEDQDGFYAEKDEKDLMFARMSNMLTTRTNVFMVTVLTRVMGAYGPGVRVTDALGNPYREWKTSNYVGQREMHAVVDRTTCLRRVYKGNGTPGDPDLYDFSGPMAIRLLRYVP